jgi:alpha-glucosidase (family GH31 glycosyl hydrolase)
MYLLKLSPLHRRRLFVALLATMASTAFAQSTALLESPLLRLEVDTDPYAYRVIEKATSAVLLSRTETRFTIGGRAYTVSRAQDVTQGASALEAALLLSGTTHTAHVTFSFTDPAVIEVRLRPEGAAATRIGESFADQGEHCYGIWEYPFGGAIDNRGADRDFLGYQTAAGTNYANARAPFYVTSRKYGLYVESTARGRYSIAVAGRTSFAFDEPELTYHVLYGPSYAEVLHRYNTLAGPPIMPPAWAFGSIWWRDDHHGDLRRVRNAQEKVIEDADQLRTRRIPASAIWIDRPYTTGSRGWGDMDFDSSFPDPAGMVADLEARGMKLLVWITNRCLNELGTEGSQYGYLFEGYTDWPAADMRIPEARDWFKAKLSYFTGLGIRGYKIDRGEEGEMPLSMQNLNAILFPTVAAEGMADEHGNDFFIFARNLNDTGRRSCAVWNGDTDDSFNGIAVSVKNALRCAAMNFPMWGSDTGGYFGSPSKEVFARWLAFSAYSTMMEVLIGPNRTIWDDYDPELVTIARTFAAEHHDLIPYTRSYLYQATRTGMPVMRPLVFAYPDDESLYDLWDEYLYGGELLVAPVLTGGVTSRTVYLPAGWWLNYNDRSSASQGPQTISAPAPLDTIPVFVRAGAIVPRGDILRANNSWTANWQPALRIEVFPHEGTDASFEYYTGTALRSITASMHQGDVSVSFDDLGAGGSLEVSCTEPAAVVLNGTPLPAGAGYTYDAARHVLSVPFTGATTLAVQGTGDLFSDVTAPAIAAVHPLGDLIGVEVVFSEPVEEETATDPANYAISGSVLCTGAAFGANDFSVILATTPHTAGQTYTLTVNNVRDRASPPNVIAAGTTATYTPVLPPVLTDLWVASGRPYEIVEGGPRTGDLHYVDRDYVFSEIPALLEGLTYVRTANDDKLESGSTFLRFTADRDVIVYVAHDDRLEPKPPWLQDFTDTGEGLNDDDPWTIGFSILAKRFDAGEIVLGGNSGEPQSSMYTVFVAPVLDGLFARGDPNADGSSDLADPVFLLSYLFGGTAAPPCMKSADANDDGAADISDAIYVLRFLFGQGPPPPAPFGACGQDPSPDGLSCEAFGPCE